MNDIGRRIKELRWDMRLTQRHLAAATGIGCSTIQGYEQGASPLTDIAARKLSQFFNVSEAYLRCESDDKTVPESDKTVPESDKTVPESDARNVETIKENNSAVSGMSIEQALQIVDKLEKLVALFKDEAITEEEYNLIKSRIIGK